MIDYTNFQTFGGRYDKGIAAVPLQRESVRLTKYLMGDSKDPT